MTWRLSRDREFSLSSSYYLSIPEQASIPPFTGCWVWGLNTLLKIKYFLWLCHYDSILVRRAIYAKGINCSTSCHLCHKQEESIIHAVRDCPVAGKFWLSMGVPQSLVNFLRLDLLEWLKENSLRSSQIQANGMPWCSQFPFAIWSLWKHKNRTTFDQCR